MVIYVRVQGRRKFQPQEYMEYFEDWNLSLTQKSGIKCRFAKVSISFVKSEYFSFTKCTGFTPAQAELYPKP